MYSCLQTDQIDILISKSYTRFHENKRIVSRRSNYGMRGDIGIDEIIGSMMITRSRKIHEIGCKDDRVYDRCNNDWYERMT